MSYKAMVCQETKLNQVSFDEVFFMLLIKAYILYEFQLNFVKFRVISDGDEFFFLI